MEPCDYLLARGDLQRANAYLELGAHSHSCGSGGPITTTANTDNGLWQRAADYDYRMIDPRDFAIPLGYPYTDRPILAPLPPTTKKETTKPMSDTCNTHPRNLFEVSILDLKTDDWVKVAGFVSIKIIAKTEEEAKLKAIRAAAIDDTRDLDTYQIVVKWVAGLKAKIVEKKDA